MELGRCIAIFVLISALLASGTAFAARAKKQLAPAQSSGAYQNKPIQAGATVWYCVYNGATDILCQLGDAGNRLAARVTQAIDPRLPKIVGDILNTPERLAGGYVSIPMHSMPFDFELVGQLAEAVMCSTKSACGVIFGETRDQLAMLVSKFESERPALPSHLASSASYTDLAE